MQWNVNSTPRLRRVLFWKELSDSYSYLNLNWYTVRVLLNLNCQTVTVLLNLNCQTVTGLLNLNCLTVTVLLNLNCQRVTVLLNLNWWIVTVLNSWELLNLNCHRPNSNLTTVFNKTWLKDNREWWDRIQSPSREFAIANGHFPVSIIILLCSVENLFSHSLLKKRTVR